MINPRYAAAVAVLLAVALVPTVIHSYRGAHADDGWRTTRLPETLADARSTPTGRRPGWVRETFATDDWIERTFRINGVETTLFVARSYDPKRLYHHPELALLRGTQTTPAGVTTSRARPDLPLHLVETERAGARGIAVYALHYDETYVDDPLLFQLRTSIELLVSRRKPMTIFMTHALAGSANAIDEAPAVRLLLSAIGAFEQQEPDRSAR
jgi:hypothetical protein